MEEKEIKEAFEVAQNHHQVAIYWCDTCKEYFTGSEVKEGKVEEHNNNGHKIIEDFQDENEKLDYRSFKKGYEMAKLPPLSSPSLKTGVSRGAD
jgi:hypothetical protein